MHDQQIRELWERQAREARWVCCLILSNTARSFAWYCAQMTRLVIVIRHMRSTILRTSISYLAYSFACAPVLHAIERVPKIPCRLWAAWQLRWAERETPLRPADHLDGRGTLQVLTLTHSHRHTGEKWLPKSCALTVWPKCSGLCLNWQRMSRLHTGLVACNSENNVNSFWNCSWVNWNMEQCRWP